MNQLKRLIAVINLISILFLLNSPIISYAVDQETKEIESNYEIKEQETWDISKNKDESVIAKWSLEDRTITISGNGEMKDWKLSTEEEWHKKSYNSLVEKIKIKEGITSIGKNAFYNCSNLINIDIPNSIISIGDNAFDALDAIPLIAFLHTFIAP